jgi:hypothetical protein
MKANNHDLAHDFDGLVRPSQIFEHPKDVVSDPDLSLNEKRAVLASWASDACAVEAAPTLRKTPSGRVVSFDEIMDAMRSLDGEFARSTRAKPSKAASVNHRGMSGQGNHGAPLH